MSEKLLKSLRDQFPIYPIPKEIVGSAYDESELENQRQYEGKTGIVALINYRHSSGFCLLLLTQPDRTILQQDGLPLRGFLADQLCGHS